MKSLSLQMFKKESKKTDDLIRMNYLGVVRRGDFEFSDTHTIAKMIVDPNGNGNLDHWRRSAVTLLIMVILHTLYAKKDKTLTGVVNFLSNPNQQFYKIFDSIMLTEHDSAGKYGWVDPSTGQITKTHPIIASMAREFKNKTFEEASNILSTALAYLTVFRDPIIAKNTNSESDWPSIDLVAPEHLKFESPLKKSGYEMP